MCPKTSWKRAKDCEKRKWKRRDLKNYGITTECFLLALKQFRRRREKFYWVDIKWNCSLSLSLLKPHKVTVIYVFLHCCCANNKNYSFGIIKRGRDGMKDIKYFLFSSYIVSLLPLLVFIFQWKEFFLTSHAACKSSQEWMC